MRRFCLTCLRMRQGMLLRAEAAGAARLFDEYVIHEAVFGMDDGQSAEACALSEKSEELVRGQVG
jgi:hypothetical protein